MIAAILLVFGIGMATGAYGAQPARVDVDGASLLNGPDSSQTVIVKLRKGQALAASNYSTQGYYKVRTRDGKIGWVAADTLLIAGGLKAPASSSGEFTVDEE